GRKQGAGLAVDREGAEHPDAEGGRLGLGVGGRLGCSQRLQDDRVGRRGVHRQRCLVQGRGLGLGDVVLVAQEGRGVVLAGLIVAGLVLAGLVPAGLVLAGLVPAGLVLAGLVPAGLVLGVVLVVDQVLVR